MAAARPVGLDGFRPGGPPEVVGTGRDRDDARAHPGPWRQPHRRRAVRRRHRDASPRGRAATRCCGSARRCCARPPPARARTPPTCRGCCGPRSASPAGARCWSSSPTSSPSPAGSSRCRLLARRHDVVAIQVVDPRESELPAVGMVYVEDAETGEQIFVDTNDPVFRERLRRGAAGAPGRPRRGSAHGRAPRSTRSRPTTTSSGPWPASPSCGAGGGDELPVARSCCSSLLAVPLLVVAYRAQLRRRDARSCPAGRRGAGRRLGADAPTGGGTSRRCSCSPPSPCCSPPSPGPPPRWPSRGARAPSSWPSTCRRAWPPRTSRPPGSTPRRPPPGPSSRSSRRPSGWASWRSATRRSSRSSRPTTGPRCWPPSTGSLRRAAPPWGAGSSPRSARSRASRSASTRPGRTARRGRGHRLLRVGGRRAALRRGEHHRPRPAGPGRAGLDRRRADLPHRAGQPAGHGAGGRRLPGLHAPRRGHPQADRRDHRRHLLRRQRHRRPQQGLQRHRPHLDRPHRAARDHLVVRRRGRGAAAAGRRRLGRSARDGWSSRCPSPSPTPCWACWPSRCSSRHTCGSCGGAAATRSGSPTSP